MSLLPVLSPLRTGRITGSRVGAVLGLSKWATPDDVLRAMVREHFGDDPEFTGSEATEWGQSHEADAIAAYETYSFVTVHGAQEIVLHPEWPDLLAVTPDGLVSGDGMVEVKCPWRARYQSIAEKPEYAAQVQLQLACAGRDWCDFVIYRLDGPLLVERVFADPSWLPSVLPTLQAFHERYLATIGDEELAAPHRASLERSDDEWAQAAARYVELAEQKEHVDGQLAEAKETLIGLSPVGGKGCGVSVSRTVRKGTVAYKAALAALAPDADLDAYRAAETTVWSVRVS